MVDKKKYLKLNENLIQPVLPPFQEIERCYGLPKTFGNPGKDVKVALDSAIKPVLSLLQHSIGYLGKEAFPQFLGYGFLVGLSQDGLIRAGVEMIADEMTSKWITLKRSGSTDNNETIIALNQEIEAYKTQELFREAAACCGYYGGCLIFIDTGEPIENLTKPLVADDAKTFPVGTIKGFKLIEPVNISPGIYNASNPLSEDYYKPTTWWVQGIPVHRSRFLYFAQNKISTLLLPAYNFFGIPQSQIVLDSVMHFEECREASARLLTKFSLTVLKTDMAEILSGGAGEQLSRRVQYMVQNKNNDGVQVIDKEREDIINVTTPLSGVTDIVRQSMEMVAAYFNEPVIKMWGISPAGFNATGEADLKNHAAHIQSQQAKIFNNPLKKLLNLLQLNKFGKIDKQIKFEFNPLNEDDEEQVANVQKIKAETGAMLVETGVVSAEEERDRLANDPKSDYNSIDPFTVPTIPEENEETRLDVDI